MTLDNHLTRRTLLQVGSAIGLAAATSAPIAAAERCGPIVSGLLGHVCVGKGKLAVVVLHEWTTDHRNYDPVLPYLSEDEHSYVFADLRGYGSSKGLCGKYSIEEAAADLLRLMDHLGHHQFCVVCHSMSGMIGQYLALVAKDRVRGVVAISPVAPTGFQDEAQVAWWRTVVTDDNAARKLIAARTDNRYSAAWIRRKLRLVRTSCTREAMNGYLDMLAGTDFSAQVRGLDVPVRLIVGAHDLPAFRAEAAESLFRGLYPNLTVTVIQDAGHYAMLETPVLLASMVDAALRDIAPGQASPEGHRVPVADIEIAD
jgi:pimeloyl-ACP methyl ester carboxylesterase